MPRLLSLYLFRQLLVTFLFAGMAVGFVVLFTQSFRLLAFVIDNSSSLWVFGQLMGLMIPTFLPLIVPIALGVAVLFYYHKLAVDSEIVVMQAAGISPLRLAAPAVMLALLAVGTGYALTTWITPAANRALVALQYRVRDDFSIVMIRPGTFNDLAEGLTLYARRRGQDGGLEDLLVHDVRAPAAPVTIMAKAGRLTVEEGKPSVEVFDGRRQSLDLACGRLEELRFERYVLDLQLLRGEKVQRDSAPRELSMRALATGTESGAEVLSPRKRGLMRAELHQRLGGPLLALTFSLIAVTVILVGDFNRRGMARRVALAGIAIVVVQAAMIGLVAQVARFALFVPLLYVVALAPIPFCFYLLDARAALARRLGAYIPGKKGGRR